jgi:uncharacterized membrane protein YbaN (DUF454 family)
MIWGPRPRTTFATEAGVLSVRDPRVFHAGNRAFCARLVRAALAQPEVRLARVALDDHACRLEFGPGPISQRAMADRFAAAVRAALSSSEPEVPLDPGAPVVATGLRRWRYLALAGGSFGLTIVGLVVPGIPTVPFLLMTSYYLVRSSPALNRRLSRSKLFGPILHDWQDRGALRPSNKRKLAGLALGISAVTLLLLAPSVEVVIVIVIVAAASLYGIMRLPEIHDDAAPPALA